MDFADNTDVVQKAKIKVAVSVDKQRTLIRIYMENTFLYEGEQMIDPRICYANEPGFGACVPMLRSL